MSPGDAEGGAGVGQKRIEFLAVVKRPRLWVEGLRAALAHRGLRPSGTEALLAWRRATAYGDAAHPVTGHDLVEYLRWRRRQRSARA